MSASIVPMTSENAPIWAALCNALWPHNSEEEMLAAFANGEYDSEYLYALDGAYIAFVSLAVRNDYVEGKEGIKPVGYLEAIYVKPEYRRQGIAKALVTFAREWSLARGCSMLASDCELENKESRLFHNKVGFNEESINVHFKMTLGE